MAFLVSGSIISTDDASVANTNNVSVYPMPLGVTYGPDTFGSVHRYMRYDQGTNSVAAAAGGIVGYILTGAATYRVTADQASAAGGNAGRNGVVGVTHNAITNGNAGWVQIAGATIDAVTLATGNSVAGDLMVWSTTNNRIAAYVDGTSEEAIFMVSVVASASSVIAVGNAMVMTRI